MVGKWYRVKWMVYIRNFVYENYRERFNNAKELNDCINLLIYSGFGQCQWFDVVGENGRAVLKPVDLLQFLSYDHYWHRRLCD